MESGGWRCGDDIEHDLFLCLTRLCNMSNIVILTIRNQINGSIKTFICPLNDILIALIG